MQLAYDLTKACKAMSMTKRQFLALVGQGILPRPVKLGEHERWNAKELEASLRGERITGFEDIKW